MDTLAPLLFTSCSCPMRCVLALAILASAAALHPPYEGVGSCGITTCTYIGGKTRVTTNGLEHWHCHKQSDSSSECLESHNCKCACTCHVAFRCTLEHHHRTGYIKVGSVNIILKSLFYCQSTLLLFSFCFPSPTHNVVVQPL